MRRQRDGRAVPDRDRARGERVVLAAVGEEAVGERHPLERTHRRAGGAAVPEREHDLTRRQGRLAELVTLDEVRIVDLRGLVADEQVHLRRRTPARVRDRAERLRGDRAHVARRERRQPPRVAEPGAQREVPARRPLEVARQALEAEVISGAEREHALRAALIEVARLRLLVEAIRAMGDERVGDPRRRADVDDVRVERRVAVLHLVLRAVDVRGVRRGVTDGRPLPTTGRRARRGSRP